MSTAHQKLSRAQACSEDARAQYFRYRHQQLVTLYEVLAGSKHEFSEAIVTDTGKSLFESTLEVDLVLRHIKAVYESISFETLTKRAATLRQGGHLEAPRGLTVVFAHWTAPLDSSLCPTSAAIASGNIVVSVLPLQAVRTYELLTRLLKGRLDADAYPFLLGSSAVVEQVLNRHFDMYYVTSIDLVFRQRVWTSAAANSSRLQLLPELHTPTRHNACIVSKTVDDKDLADTARHITRGSFGAVAGQGLSAISLVVVHEARYDALCRELSVAARDQFPRSITGWRDLAQLNQQTTDFNALIRKVESADLICGGDYDKKMGVFGPTIIGCAKSANDAFTKVVKGPLLAVLPFTSTEDAICLLRPNLGHCLAVFGNRLEAEYFANELQPCILSSNSIPLEKLVGITPPDADPHQGIRCSPELFSKKTLVASGASKLLDNVFPPYSAWQFMALGNAILPKFSKVLVAKRTSHSHSVGRNFFLQGAFLSLGIVATLIGTAGYLAFDFFRRRSV